jgi:hypothetical protein
VYVQSEKHIHTRNVQQTDRQRGQIAWVVGRGSEIIEQFLFAHNYVFALSPFFSSAFTSSCVWCYPLPHAVDDVVMPESSMLRDCFLNGRELSLRWYHRLSHAVNVVMPVRERCLEIAFLNVRNTIDLCPQYSTLFLWLTFILPQIPCKSVRLITRSNADETSLRS